MRSAVVTSPQRDHAFDSEFHDPWALHQYHSDAIDKQWSPSADVIALDGDFYVFVDLPGVDPHAIEIHLQGRRVIIEGTRRQFCKDGDVVHRECSTGRFHRTLCLPDSASTSSFSREHRHGTLILHFPASTG